MAHKMPLLFHGFLFHGFSNIVIKMKKITLKPTDVSCNREAGLTIGSMAPVWA